MCHQVTVTVLHTVLHMSPEEVRKQLNMSTSYIAFFIKCPIRHWHKLSLNSIRKSKSCLGAELTMMLCSQCWVKHNKHDLPNIALYCICFREIWYVNIPSYILSQSPWRWAGFNIKQIKVTLASCKSWQWITMEIIVYHNNQCYVFETS